MIIAVLPALVRGLVEPHLPAAIEARWWASAEDLARFAPEAEIGWFDMNDQAAMLAAVHGATRLGWFTSIYSGLDFLPLDLLAGRGVTVTNGAGLNANAVAEYALLGMLAAAKDFCAVVRAADAHDWLADAPGKRELAGSRALILGYGAIGRLIGDRLAAFGVDVVPVRRSGGEGALGPHQWRERLADFDWIVLAVPATAETAGMIGKAELAAMKRAAVLVNMARGEVVDQAALVAALQARTIGGAVLDVATPEPLPADHPLWDCPNTLITMHLSGRAQTTMYRRGAERFIANCARYCAGEPVAPKVDLALGY